MNSRIARSVALSATLIMPVAACVSVKPPVTLEGLKSARAPVITWKKGRIGVLPMALAKTVKTCWDGKDALFQGFKASESEAREGGIIALRLDGPLAGDPPQRFLVLMRPAPEGKPGYSVEIEYPLGSNYAFVRDRLARDIRTLEDGRVPCS